MRPLRRLQLAALTCVLATVVAGPMGPDLMRSGQMGQGMMGGGPMSPGRMGGMGAAMAGMGPGMGAGMGGMGPEHMEYMQVWHQLLSNHKLISRSVNNTSAGISSITWSNDPATAQLIQKHVHQMKGVLESCSRQGGCPAPFRRFDPLFVAIFKDADKIAMQVTNKMTPQGAPLGIAVDETGKDAYSKKLVQAHAAVVSSFVNQGHTAAHDAHPVP